MIINPWTTHKHLKYLVSLKQMNITLIIEFRDISLASFLIFVGLKMVWLNEAFGGKLPIGWSLGIIATLIGSSVVVSVVMDSRKQNLNPRLLPNY